MADPITGNRIGKFRRFYVYASKINLFDDKETMSITDQLLSTRVFILLLATALMVVFIFTVFSVRTHTVIIPFPSERPFQTLSSRHPSTLLCPCTQASIRPDQFISFDLQYHSICTSQLVNHSFISSLSHINTSEHYTHDYRVTIASHFQILALLCRNIKQMTSDSINKSTSEQLITAQVLLPSTFNAQVQQLVDQLKSSTMADIRHKSDFLSLSILQNGIYSGLRTNYVDLVENGTQLLKRSYGTSYSIMNKTCTCASNVNCVAQAELYNFTGFNSTLNSTINKYILRAQLQSLLIIPGLMTGCLPYDSLLHSTLECFYNQSCIVQLRQFIYQFSLVTPLAPPYNFPANTTVKGLVDHLFIESWNEHSSFSAYYHVCSPSSCSYLYNRRFNLFDAIVTLIGLFGGLNTSIRLCAPYIIKIFRRLQRCRCCRRITGDTSPEREPASNQSWKDRFLNFIIQVKGKIVTLNVFSSLSDVRDGIYATRLYLGSLVLGFVILVFYASISVQVRSITVDQPSLSGYEQLYRRFPSTLMCPCTRLSVPHSMIIHIQPHYHQVCSSDFIRNDKWFHYFDDSRRGLHPFDFRSMGEKLFTLLQTLCLMSTETVTNDLAVFNDTQMVSPSVLARNIFDKQLFTIIRQFQQQTTESFLNLFELVRTLIQLNQFMIFGDTNAHLVYFGKFPNRYWRSIPLATYDNDCSCGKNVSCIRPEGFYCTSTNSSCQVYNAKPNQTIPGLVSSCLFIDSLLASTLECFYNRSCIQMLTEWYTFGRLNRTLDPRAANVTPLDPKIQSRFLPYSTVDEIASQLFIDYWTNVTEFSSYYSHCAPKQCTYSYETRFNRLYIITTVTGLAGGLSVTLKILAKLLIKLLRRIHRCCRRRSAPVARTVPATTSIRDQLSRLILQLRHTFVTLNVYKKQQKSAPSSPQSPDGTTEILVEQRQRIATRFYIVLLFLSLDTIIIFSVLQSEMQSIEIPSPTQSMFESLRAGYSFTLSCPCSQIAIPYSTFVSVQPAAFHQVCSSYFVSGHFIDLLWGSENPYEYLLSVDRKVLSTQFRLLSSLCSFAMNFTENKIAAFASRELISLETLAPHLFHKQIDAMIDSFVRETPANFQTTQHYVIDMLHANQLVSIFFTNWEIHESTAREGYFMLFRPTAYDRNGHPCSCSTSSTCSRSWLSNNETIDNFTGLVLGCLPVYGLRQSTLECFYNATCLTRLTTFFQRPYMPLPLNASVSTRFTPVSSVSIGTLIDELFIETWQRSSNYSNYYLRCAPLVCRYTYMKETNSLYVIITLLSLYGGLCIGLKFVVWYSLRLYWKIASWITRRRGQVGTEHEN